MRCINTDSVYNKRNTTAAVGIGTMIIFIAMILVAGIAASVLIQTMDDLQGQAMKTGSESISDISTGLEVVQVSGHQVNGNIDRLGIMISSIAGSNDIDLSTVLLHLSTSDKQIYCSFNNSLFNASINNGIFRSLQTSSLGADEFGIVVVRDFDTSCTQYNPVITQNDLVVIIVNTTQSFSGIAPREDLIGSVTPESGLTGHFQCTTPTCFVDTIIELHP